MTLDSPATPTFVSTCALCQQIAGTPENDEIHRLLGQSTYKRRVIDLVDGFSLIPSLGALGQSHFLICTRHHRRRIADACRDEWDAFHESFNLAWRIMSSGWGGDVVAFEHGGSRRSSAVPCSVEHAHLHLVSLPVGTAVVLPAMRWQPVTGGFVAAHEQLDDREYLLWFDDRRGVLVTQPVDGDPLPSQILRRAVAEALAPQPAWNWRTHPDPERADRMYSEALAALTQVFECTGPRE